MLENFSELVDQEDTKTLANPLFANPVYNDGIRVRVKDRRDKRKKIRV